MIDRVPDVSDELTTAGGDAAPHNSGEQPPVGVSVDMPLAWLIPATYNPRRHFDETALRELADSIRTHGLLEPLVVREIAVLSDRSRHRRGREHLPDLRGDRGRPALPCMSYRRPRRRTGQGTYGSRRPQSTGARDRRLLHRRPGGAYVHLELNAHIVGPC